MSQHVLEHSVTLSREPQVFEDCCDMLEQEIAFIYADEFETLKMEEAETAVSATDIYQPADVEAAASSDLPSYIAALYAIPLLTASGEAALFRKMNYLRYQANIWRSILDPDDPSPEAIAEIRALLAEAMNTRNQIIESNLRLVVAIARKFASSSQITFEDLISEGNTILMKAVDKFDYSRGFRFSTYATHSVQRHFYRQFKQAQRRSSKEQTVSDEILNDTQNTDENEGVDESSTRDALLLMSQMDGCLSDREQFVVKERFGLGEYGSVRTYHSLATELGVCKERVRQILNAAVGKLKALSAELKIDRSAE